MHEPGSGGDAADGDTAATATGAPCAGDMICTDDTGGGSGAAAAAAAAAARLCRDSAVRGELSENLPRLR